MGYWGPRRVRTVCAWVGSETNRVKTVSPWRGCPAEGVRTQADERITFQGSRVPGCGVWEPTAAKEGSARG